MNGHSLQTIAIDPWEHLRTYTRARIALGRCGSSIPTSEMLDFQLCHAKARDAVHAQLDFEGAWKALERISGEKVFVLNSRVRDRSGYLRRPDLGRRLSEASAAELKAAAGKEGCDIALVIADGLSATAIEENAVPFFELLLPALKEANYKLAPICLVKEGRVAVADEIGEILGAKLAVNFIGERPGLTSANSMGIYMTYDPAIGSTDERRNCISNIRPEGMPCSAGVSKLLYLIQESLRKKLSGVHLKDMQSDLVLEQG